MIDQFKFGATKRETVVKTTTTMTTTAAAKSIGEWRKKTEPNRSLKAEPIPKSRILVADRKPAKEPT